jgi:hypothetical protein
MFIVSGFVVAALAGASLVSSRRSVPEVTPAVRTGPAAA